MIRSQSPIGETLCLVSISLQFWLCISLGLGLVCLFIFQEVLGLVLCQKNGNLKNLLRSCHVLVSVFRLKSREYRSLPGLSPILNIKSLGHELGPGLITNIGNLDYLLRSHRILFRVLRQKVNDFWACPRLIPIVNIKKSQSWPCPFVNVQWDYNLTMYDSRMLLLKLLNG